MIYFKARLQELEGRLELEVSTKNRLSSAVDRLKDQLEDVGAQRDRLTTSLQKEQETSRSAARNLREEREAKEAVERKLVDEERRRTDQSYQMSSCLQEQFRLQQKLSRLLLKSKENQLSRCENILQDSSYDLESDDDEDETKVYSLTR